MTEDYEKTNIQIIGEVRKNFEHVLQLCVADFKNRTFIYLQTWKKDDGEDGLGEPTHGGLTMRPGTLRELMPLFEEAMKVAGARGGQRGTKDEPWLNPALRRRP